MSTYYPSAILCSPGVQFLGPCHDVYREDDPCNYMFNVRKILAQWYYYLHADITRSGRSILCRDFDVMASINLLDGVDWYSLSNSKFITSSKVPISKGFSASSMAYVDSGNKIITGGISGRAYILCCRTFEIQEELDHRGACDYYLWPRG